MSALLGRMPSRLWDTSQRWEPSIRGTCRNELLRRISGAITSPCRRCTCRPTTRPTRHRGPRRSLTWTRSFTWNGPSRKKGFTRRLTHSQRHPVEFSTRQYVGERHYASGSRRVSRQFCSATANCRTSSRFSVSMN